MRHIFSAVAFPSEDIPLSISSQGFLPLQRKNKVVSFLCLFTEQGFNKAERFSYDSSGTTAFYGIADLLACNDSYAVYPPLAFPCVAYECIGNNTVTFFEQESEFLVLFMQTYFFAYSFIDRISSLSAFCPLHVFLQEPYVRFL